MEYGVILFVFTAVCKGTAGFKLNKVKQMNFRKGKGPEIIEKEV